MKSAVVFLMLVSACSSWRNTRPREEWVYTPTYTDNCSATTLLTIEGRYAGQNLYMMNPQLYCSDSTTCFTTISISINDTILIPSDSLASSAFEIPLTRYGFQNGDTIKIVVKHRAAQPPKLLNPEVH
jgi:hypothetical protein